MELQEIALWSAAGGAIGSLMERTARRLVPIPESIRRMAPRLIPEIITAALFAALASRIDSWPQLLAYGWFTAVGVSLAITDLTIRRLPNALIIPSYPALLALFCVDAVSSHNTTPLLRSAASMMVTLAAFTAMYGLAPGQLGGGDVKLSGLIGLALGHFSWTAAFTGILLAWLLAAFGALVVRLSRKSQREGLPFGTCLIVASITEVLANS
ncbi:A24 family peptidase [Streptomyces sp. NPDC046805]|uniref:A24 family peptidase n=1 Tax=Streptomyces sp. NPDC046805 TaxID=3155134 RepID=UPI0033C58F48